MARIDQAPFVADILDLSHDGRGVARRPDGHPAAGKTVFVSGALPGEQVLARQTGRSRHFDEAQVVEVLQASPERVPPRCVHFGTCGGCALQHLDEARQIHAKQRTLLENLERIGHVAPETVLPPLVDAAWGYRRKGRFSVRRVEKKGKTLVGFREQDPRFVADLSECHTVVPAIGERIGALSALIDSLQVRNEIPQVEFIVGDATGAPCTARSRSPTGTRSGKARSAPCSRSSGSPARAAAGGTRTRAAAGSRSRADPRSANRNPHWHASTRPRSTSRSPT